MGIRDFLVAAKSGLTELTDEVKVHLVIGNESCDLDSVVAACTFAYFLHESDRDGDTLYLPLLNIPRHNFHIRLEIVYFLGKHGIHADDLTFVDDLNLTDLAATKGNDLKATLVDHHVLHRTMESLRSAVVEVLDHRPQEGELPDSWRVQNERVGSCCTLVSQRMLTGAAIGDFDMGETEAEMLLGTILTDTGNMSTLLNLGTPADHDIVLQLQSYLPADVSPTDIFEEIYAKKNDLSSLTVREMLEKDAKVLKGTDLTVVMSSISMAMEEVIVRPEFGHDTEDYLAAQSADVLVVMTIAKERRYIAIISQSPVYREQIADVLLHSTSPNLDLQPYADPSHHNAKVFYQGSYKISRKGVLPLIRHFLAGESTTPDENLNALDFENEARAETSLSTHRSRSEEDARAHINLAKTHQSDSFRNSQDRYDLAAVGNNPVLSPCLSSDSEADVLTPINTDIESRLDGGLRFDLDHSSVKVSDNTNTNETFVHKELDSLSVDNLVDFDSADNSQSMEVNVASTSDLAAVTDETSSADVDVFPCNGLDKDFLEGEDGSKDFDLLQNRMPSDLLCPNESPMTSMPTSGHTSGQGSKVPSYPDTPPNSFMEPSGAMFFKETQLPSFNSSEMVKRINDKKAKMSGHSMKSKNTNFGFLLEDDDDMPDNASVEHPGGSSSSGGAGSLISPAVPTNSRHDLAGNAVTYDATSPNFQLPTLMTNADMLERVNEKRSQLDWVDGSTEMMTAAEGVSNDVKSLKRFDSSLPIPLDHSGIDCVPYTPQNSYVGGSFDSFARSNLPSMNSAEMVARIKAKQSAMFGSSGGSSGRVSHGSDDSGGCRSPDVIVGKGSRGSSLDSPQVAYTPQNSYRDGINYMMDGRNRLPDLNEVAERLSVENVGTKFRTYSNGSADGGGSREEEVNVNQHNKSALRKGHNSTSHSDSQNTMSDVESLFGGSTDVVTPSDNVVASSLAGAMKSDATDAGISDGQDVNNSESESARSQVNLSDNMVRFKDPNVDEENEADSENKVDLFSPVDPDLVTSSEDRMIFDTAEDLVANSIAAAVAVNSQQGEANGLYNAMVQNSDSDSGKRNVSFAVDESLESLESDVEKESLKADKLSDLALNELAFELANEMIQSVLEDFPFTHDGQTEMSDYNKTGSLAPSRRIGLDNTVALEIENMENSDVASSFDSTPNAKDNLIDDRKLSVSSEASMSSTSERKRSREIDSAMTVIEGELKSSFPERRVTTDFNNEDETDEIEEVIESFPGRRFSKSDDFPSRRFSREENSSRGSSKESPDAVMEPDSLETEYMPNMDPLQGSLDIMGNESYMSKITDVDREVVEGESFRKVSGQEYKEQMHIERKEEEIKKALSKKSNQNNNADTSEERSSSTETEEEVISEGCSEEIKPGPSSLKAKNNQKRKIKVSFSEEFDEEVGDFHIEQRSGLKSPPPPSNSSVSPSPPPSPPPSEVAETMTDAMTSSPSESQLKEDDGSTKEVYLTSMGRISIDAEPGDPSVSAPNADPARMRERIQGADQDGWQDDSVLDVAGQSEFEGFDDTAVESPGHPLDFRTDPASSSQPVEGASTAEQTEKRWMKVSSSRGEFSIDLDVVEPYKNVVSHGGYFVEGLSAIIVFYGCHLPSRAKESNYSYIMEHLFHYVIHTLEELVADDYVIIYFHGSTPRKQMPGLGWLKRCYQSIDRRLKKNLKGLFMVHPTLFLRTVVTMIKPFISAKFSSKLKFVRTLEELNALVPLQKVNIPEKIVHYDIHHTHMSSPPPSPSHPSTSTQS